VPTYIGLQVLLALVFAAMYVTGTEVIAMAVTMFLWGAVGFAKLTPLQMIVINAAKEAPNLASTLLQSAFHTGIAAGSFVGSAALTVGFDYASLPWIGAVLRSMCAVIGMCGPAPCKTAAAPRSCSS
jgi:DHA1 family inner membrane transport protein